MNYNSLNGGKHATLVKSSKSAERFSRTPSDESFGSSSNNPGRPQTRVPVPQYHGMAPRPQFSVVLTSSPNKSAYREVKLQDDLAEDRVRGDLSPQPKKQRVAKHTHVPLPSIPGMYRSFANSSQPNASKLREVASTLLPKGISQQVSGASGTSTPQSTASKGRGRPKGWRPGMTYAELRGTRPPDGTRAVRQVKVKPGDMTIIRKRGRPSKQASPPPTELYLKLKPRFLVFLCEWEGCNAELHNLETLRLHINIVHIQRQKRDEIGMKQCRWAKCGEKTPAPDYLQETDLELHVEDEHLIPFGWHMGDGPSNEACRPRSEGGDVPEYLKDANGNLVTPSIKDQEIEDIMTWKQNRRKLKDMLMRRDANLPSDDESDVPENGEAALM